MATILDEIIEKVPILTSEERNVLINLLEKEEDQEESNHILKRISEPFYEASSNLNIEWLKKNKKDFAGKYVALKDGKLVAIGKTFKEVHLKSKELGIQKPLFHYIPAKDEIVWGGW